MKTLKTKLICIFTTIFILISTAPTAVFAVDTDSSVADGHANCTAEHHHCSDEIPPEIETNAVIPPPNDTMSVMCLFGLHAMLVSYETIETGGRGYEYCNSYTEYKISHCIECGELEIEPGEQTIVPHDWSVGWCGQTCKECGIVEMFHEAGGCWYCS